MQPETHTVTIPIKIGQTHAYGKDQFVRVVHVAQGRWFHKVYITIKDGKVHSSKVIKILNTRIFEFGGTVFLKGSDIEKTLVKGSEIL